MSRFAAPSKMIIRLLITIFGLIVLTACASLQRKTAPAVAAPNVHQELNQAQMDLAAQAYSKALNRLEQIEKNHPGTDAALDAAMLRGDVFTQMGDFQSAYEAYISIVDSRFLSANEGSAIIKAASALYRLGRLDEALALTGRSLRVSGLSPGSRAEALKLQFTLLNMMGDRLGALRALVELAETDPDQNARNSHRIQAMDYVETRLSDQDLLEVARLREYQFVRPYALYRTGLYFFEQADFSRSRSFLSGVIDVAPGTELAETAQNLIAQIDARRQVHPKTVGAVLPLTGRQASVGQRALKGLQLGLGIYGSQPSDLRLAVVDSEGNPDSARRAVERLVVEDQVIAIVGSLMSRTALAVASKAEELGVPSIALSQRQGVTETGQMVFRNALTSDMQVRHLVNQAMDEMGLKRFAILFPNDSYGVEYTNLFWDEVLARGGQITAVQTYNPDETDFTGAFQRLIGTYYLEDRAEEYRERFNTWFERQGRRMGRTPPPEDLLPPVVNFDAIFIPDSIRAMGQISPMLAYFGIQGVKLLGTNLWNSELFVRRGQRHVEGSYFVDGLLVDDPNFKNSQFFREFRATFGEDPGIFEAQAYEAGLVLRQFIASGETSRAGLARRLERLSDFPGAFGQLQMSERREFTRPLVGLTVYRGQILPFDQAPKDPKNPESP